MDFSTTNNAIESAIERIAPRYQETLSQVDEGGSARVALQDVLALGVGASRRGRAAWEQLCSLVTEATARKMAAAAEEEIIADLGMAAGPVDAQGRVIRRWATEGGAS